MKYWQIPAFLAFLQWWLCIADVKQLLRILDIMSFYVWFLVEDASQRPQLLEGIVRVIGKETPGTVKWDWSKSAFVVMLEI